MNRLAISFVNNLCSAFQRFPITEETKALYVRKLSGWTLSPKQWESILDELIAMDMGYDNGRLPPLNLIYDKIKHTIISASNSDYGQVSFTYLGYDRVIRCKRIGSEWLSIQTGNKPHVPVGATNIEFQADRKAESYREDQQPQDDPKWFKDMIEGTL